jgi:outer membrane lipoprotein-sorting protein
VRRRPIDIGWRCLAAAVVALVAVVAAPQAAAEAPAPARLSAADAADIARIEAYLNAIGTMQARFLQVSSDGGYAEGDFYLSRPGRLRIAYDPPVPVLIVANGRHLIYFDEKLNQVSYLGLDSTPAGILVDDRVSLSGRLTVTGFERGEQVLRVTLVQTDDPLAGNITLVLGDRPMVLKKWAVEDAQGLTTTVSLFAARTGVPLNPDLFEFTPPPETEPVN